MSVECLKEITDWDIPNHSYLVDKEKGLLIAYRKTGTKEWIQLSGKMRFNKSRRKFVKLPIPNL